MKPQAVASKLEILLNGRGTPRPMADRRIDSYAPITRRFLDE